MPIKSVVKKASSNTLAAAKANRKEYAAKAKVFKDQFLPNSSITPRRANKLAAEFAITGSGKPAINYIKREGLSHKGLWRAASDRLDEINYGRKLGGQRPVQHTLNNYAKALMTHRGSPLYKYHINPGATPKNTPASRRQAEKELFGGSTVSAARLVPAKRKPRKK